MNNDLISRSYLKNLPFERVIHTDFGETAIPIEEIDNAPSVELDEGVIQEVLNKRCMTVITNEYLIALLHGKIPQGEWLVKSNGTTNYYACDKCGSAGDIQDKFCRECGADMRKGGKEE